MRADDLTPGREYAFRPAGCTPEESQRVKVIGVVGLPRGWATVTFMHGRAEGPYEEIEARDIIGEWAEHDARMAKLAARRPLPPEPDPDPWEKKYRAAARENSFLHGRLHWATIELRDAGLGEKADWLLNRVPRVPYAERHPDDE